jgi:hypothetical protein
MKHVFHFDLDLGENWSLGNGRVFFSSNKTQIGMLEVVSGVTIPLVNPARSSGPHAVPTSLEQSHYSLFRFICYSNSSQCLGQR